MSQNQIKLFLNFQIYFLDYRLLLFQPENVDIDKKLQAKTLKYFFQINNKSDSVTSQHRGLNENEAECNTGGRGIYKS